MQVHCLYGSKWVTVLLPRSSSFAWNLKPTELTVRIERWGIIFSVISPFEFMLLSYTTVYLIPLDDLPEFLFKMSSLKTELEVPVLLKPKDEYTSK